MPSQHQSAATGERETFDDPRKSEAARFLDAEIMESGSKGTSQTGRELFIARVRGIDYLGAVNAWIQVERDLERGPREKVISFLERRRDYLVEHGDRDDRTVPRSEPRDLPPVETSWPDRDDVEDVDDRDVYRSSGSWGSLRDRYPEFFEDGSPALDDASTAAVATDGGEDQEGDDA